MAKAQKHQHARLRARLLDLLDGMSLSPGSPITDALPVLTGTSVGGGWQCPPGDHLGAALVVDGAVWLYLVVARVVVVLVLDDGECMQQNPPTRSPGKRKRHAYTLHALPPTALCNELSSWDVRVQGDCCTLNALLLCA